MGENKPGQRKPPLRGRITEIPIPMHITWCRILFWIRMCGPKNITPRILEKIFIWKFAWIQKKIVGKKIDIKFWVIIYAYCICMSQMLVINRSFSKMSHDSLLTTTSGFWEFEKPPCVNFWKGSWWTWQKFTIIRFCIHETKWRLKRHRPLEGYTFYLAPRE